MILIIFMVWISGYFMKFRFEMDNPSDDLVSTTQIDGFNAQGGYNIALAVSPTDKTILL